MDHALDSLIFKYTLFYYLNYFIKIIDLIHYFIIYIIALKLYDVMIIDLTMLTIIMITIIIYLRGYRDRIWIGSERAL